MFSDSLGAIAERASRISPARPSAPVLDRLLERAVDRELFDEDDLIELLGATCDPGSRVRIVEFARGLRRRGDDRVLLLPPLYFDSRCENRCGYCNFATGGGERLDIDEFAAEFEHLLDIGYRSIELVSSQDPALYRHGDEFDLADQRFEINGGLAYFEVASRLLALRGGGMLTSNIPPLDVASLSSLRGKGLDCFLVWAETFHPGQYGRLHDGETPKTSQSFRVDSYERALDAGIQHVAAGFLKGLYDWRHEEVALFALDRYLRARRGRGLSIVGTPRVKGPVTRSTLIGPYLQSDEDYDVNIALDRILFDGILWLQTRESSATNVALIRKYGAGVVLTLDSSTAPGGYREAAKGPGQFPVHKNERDAVVDDLEQAGFRVLYDWDSRVLEGTMGLA